MRNTNLLYCRPAASYPVTLPPRELDSRTKTRMQEMLAAFQAKRVRVIAVFGDSETVLFAKEIHGYLAETGWKTEPTVEIAAQPVPHKGVFIRMGLHDTSVIEVVVGANTAAGFLDRD
jgi:hypothetical protein